MQRVRKHRGQMRAREEELATKMAVEEARQQAGEAAFKARLEKMQVRSKSRVADREREFDAACASTRERLEALPQREVQLQARYKVMREQLTGIVQLSVGGMWS